MILKNLFTLSALLGCTLINSMQTIVKAEHTKRVYAVSPSNMSTRNFFPHLLQTFRLNKKIHQNQKKLEAAQALLALAQQPVKNQKKK